MPTEAEYESMISQAEELSEAGKTEEAKLVCREAVKQAQAAGDDAFIHCLRAQLADLDWEYRRALEELQRAMQLKSDSAVLNVRMGRALIHVDRYEESLAAFDKALQLKPDYIPALLGRSAALSGLFRHQEALEAADRVLNLQPRDFRALQRRAFDLAQLGRYEEALTGVEKSLAIQPNRVAGLCDRAFVLYALGRKKEAWQSLEKATALRPEHPRTMLTRGVLLGNQGEDKEALKFFEGALKIHPENPVIRRNRAIALGNVGLKDEAIKELWKLLEELPEDETTKLWLFRFEDPKPAIELEQEHSVERLRRNQEEREREIKLDAWRKLSARTAHRVDNQLFAAKGALRTLKPQARGELAEPVHDIETSLDRIARICSEFRRFSAEQPPKPQATDVHLLIEDAVRRYRKSADGIEIRESVAPLLPECRWDPHQIDQAISELLENAIRHTAKGKTVLIKAEPQEKEGKQYVRIVVQNDGKGIDARYKNRLFEPFFSLRPGGTGLGLAIVSQIIKNHGGSIMETGEPEKFARFEVELPAQISKEDSR